ncbi:MAG: PQQ-binding-like beta-propeller repeat protein, partial [Planctomycetota bacterium]
MQYTKANTIRHREHDLPPRPRRPWPPRTNTTHGFLRHWDSFAPVHPVVAQGLLLYHDGRQVHACNLYTGTPQWAFPPRPDAGDDGRTNLSSIYTPVVAGGAVYAALEVYRDYREQAINTTPITYYLPSRRLFALDLQTGRVLWSHDDEALARRPAGDATRLLRRLTITGAPLVRGDRLYVGACYSEGTFHTYLVAFDRHSGDLVFATHVSNGQQELNLFGRQLQECVPTPVAEAGGVLYFGTNLGIVAALDALLGAPIWAASYPIKPLPSTYLWFEAPRRWPDFDNGPPILVGDTLLVAPADGTHLLALDRRDGGLRWKYGSDEPGWRIRTLLGADSKRVYVGGDKVAALSLEPDPDNPRRPRRLAETPDLEEGEVFGGRGLLTRNRLWVADRWRVYEIDRRTLKIVAAHDRKADEEDYDAVINLVFGDGVLVTAGRDVVCARFDPVEVLSLAEQRVKEASGRTEPLLAAADLYLAEDALGPAIETYRRAGRRAARRGEETLRARAGAGLHRALLRPAERAAQEDPARALPAFLEAVQAAPGPAARVAARVRLEEALAGREEETLVSARLRNLDALGREHPDLALEPGTTARVWALEQAAQLHLDRNRPDLALATLQRLLEAA